MTFIAATLILLASSGFLQEYITQRMPSVIDTQWTRESPSVFNYTRAGADFGIYVIDNKRHKVLTFEETQAYFTPVLFNFGGNTTYNFLQKCTSEE